LKTGNKSEDEVSPSGPVIVVDDDVHLCGGLDSLLRSFGLKVNSFSSTAALLASNTLEQASCLVLDVQLGAENGLDFQQKLVEIGATIPVILVSAHGDIPITVRAMRAGAITFLPKPLDEGDFLSAIGEAISCDRSRRTVRQRNATALACYKSLTSREQEIMALVTTGLMNKQIAGQLGLSEITVKVHRKKVMMKMCVQNLPDLVRIMEQVQLQLPVLNDS
jgi:FixJ family two-component response regulator